MELIKIVITNFFIQNLLVAKLPFPKKCDIQYSIYQLVFTKTHVICILVFRPLSRHKYMVIKMQVAPERPSTRCFTFIS